ncbi:hypothetical protein I4U23_029227 [Adineta vaga]|nr:hypothetical protein I4U23_029227 [Adineta vaga]
MSSHHRSGGPPSLMDDVHDFDRNFHSHRFEGGRGGHGRGGGMRGRGGGEGGGMRGRGGGGGGDGGFGHRGAPRGGRGDFHQRDRFNNNGHFNRPNDEQRGGGNPSKMPSLFDIEQQHQSRPYDRDFNRGGGRGRMPFPRGGGGGRDSSVDDRNHSQANKPNVGEGPPSLLDFGNEKPGLPSNASNNSLPSLLSVQIESSGASHSGSDMNKVVDTHSEHHQDDDNSSTRSDHASHRDNQGRYRDRDSQRSGRGGFNRSSSFNRDRSRSPRDRDRHDHSRDDRSFGGDFRRGGGRGGRGGGGDHFGRGGRGGHHNNSRESHQSRFGPDNNQPPRHDRREGGRGGGRGGFHDRQRDINAHHRPDEQLPPDNHSFNRNGRSNYDGVPPQNRPFQEGFQHGNYDPMGPPQHNRPHLQPPPNFNQGPPINRPDFYPPNANNSSYPQHMRSGGRPSRFSDRQEDYEDDQPLTKPNFSLPNAPATTTPLYFNQPNNPIYSQARSSISSTFSSQQGAPSQTQSPSQFSWGNQQQGGPNAYMNQTLASIASNSQQNQNMTGPQSSNSFYGNNNDLNRQILASATTQNYPSASHPSQTSNKPPNANTPSNPSLMPLQPQVPPPTSGTNTAANASNTEAWQQYYQQYWQYMQQQQQQQQQTGVQAPTAPSNAQQQFPQGPATASKVAVNSPSTAGSTQDQASNQANTNAWTQYWIQYQAYMQQQQQQQQQQPPNSSTTNPTTLTAPSQLYSQGTGKQQTSSSNSTSNSNALSGTSVSNWQTWFNPEG